MQEFSESRSARHRDFSSQGCELPFLRGIMVRSSTSRDYLTIEDEESMFIETNPGSIAEPRAVPSPD
jgi:hypothetical protein